MTDAVVQPEFFQKQAVEIDVHASGLKGVYDALISNLNDQAILLTVPQIGNVYLPLKVGQPFLLRYVVESWAYETQVTIAARRDNLEIPIMLVNRPATVTRRLLRKFVRVVTDIDASIFLIRSLSDYGREKFSDDELTPATIEDISAGGAKIRAPFHMVTENMRYALLWFTMPLIHKSFFNMLTRIGNVQEDPPANKFIIAEFTGLSEAERDDIVQYCFRRQNELGREPSQTGADK